MKKYYTATEKSNSLNEIILLEQGVAIVNGINTQFDQKFINDNLILLRIENKNYLISIYDNDETGFYDISINGSDCKLSCKSDLEMTIEKLTNSKGESKLKNKIHSPMPGIIVKLYVKEGQHINSGEVLLVLEAMKMENEIKAVKDCMIKKIHVSEKNSVEKNELLIEIS